MAQETFSTDDTESGAHSSDTADRHSKIGRAIRSFSPMRQRGERGRLLALDIINERFVREFRLALFTLIRRNSDITAESMDIVDVDTFQDRHEDSSSLNVITLSPLRGNGLFSLPQPLVYMIVDAMYGGSSQSPTTDETRDFTTTENRIIRRVLDQALIAYGKAWANVHPIQPEFERSELQTRFCNITSSPNESVVISTFRIEIGDYTGRFTLCLPYGMIEPIREQLTRPAGQRITKQETRQRRDSLGRSVRTSSVDVSVVLGRVHSSIGAIANLTVGDLLRFELSDEVEAAVDGVPVFSGRYGKHQGKKAVRVSRVHDYASSFQDEEDNDD